MACLTDMEQAAIENQKMNTILHIRTAGRDYQPAGRTKLRFYQINNQSQFAALYGDTESSIIQSVPRLYENTGPQFARYTAGCPTRCTGYFHVCAGRFQCERSNAGPARLYRAGTQRRCAERF